MRIIVGTLTGSTNNATRTYTREIAQVIRVLLFETVTGYGPSSMIIYITANSALPNNVMRWPKHRTMGVVTMVYGESCDIV